MNDEDDSTCPSKIHAIHNFQKTREKTWNENFFWFKKYSARSKPKPFSFKKFEYNDCI